MHSDCFLSICVSCAVILHAVIFACLMQSLNSVALIKEGSIYKIFNRNINLGFVFKCTLSFLLDNMTHYQNRFHKVDVPENAFQRPCSQCYLTQPLYYSGTGLYTFQDHNFRFFSKLAQRTFITLYEGTLRKVRRNYIFQNLNIFQALEKCRVNIRGPKNNIHILI